MKQTIQKAVNLWFQDWKELHVNLDFLSFEQKLEREFPDLKFTYSTRTEEIILLTEV